jgi:hypothetical protein
MVRCSSFVRAAVSVSLALPACGADERASPSPNAAAPSTSAPEGVGSARDADVSLAEPDAAAAESDVSAAEPDVAFAEPDIAVAESDVSVVEPDARPAPAPDAAPTPPAPEPCPPGVECLDALPASVRGDTRGGPSDIPRYGCAPDVDESGPERLYRIEVRHEGLLAAALSGLDGETDVDVHLLSARDSGACLDRGHWRAAAWVRPGTYYIAVDTWVDADGEPLPGAYTLDVAWTDGAHLATAGLDPVVADRALRVFARAWAREDTDRLEYAIVDFTLESALPREWIVDLATGEVLWHLHVTHGEASAAPGDPGRAVSFSNVPESHQSSLGLMRSAETYTGDYGYSFRLDGLEPGYNDNVRRRDIVMHPWEDARPEAITAAGLPTSWGCPAIDDRLATPVVDLMAGGALYWFWYPDGDWSRRSTYLND